MVQSVLISHASISPAVIKALIIVHNIEYIHVSMKSGWLFLIIPSVTLKASKNFLSFNLKNPGITITAYVKVNPVTKAHNKMEEAKVKSKKSDVFSTYFNYFFWTSYQENCVVFKNLECTNHNVPFYFFQRDNLSKCHPYFM